MTPRLAGVDDLPTSAISLAAAFEHYPWTLHVIPEENYHQRLHDLQLLYLEYAHMHGIVAVVGNGEGVIALLPPDAPEPDPGMIDEIVRLHGDRIDRLDHADLPTDPPTGAWRLETLGVHPNSQGSGIASALLSFALTEAARRGGASVELDTSDPRNVRLYERHGFQTITHTDVGEGPPVWKMRANLPHAPGKGCSPETTAAEALSAYLAATNTHDFDQVEKLLSSDAVYFFGDATCIGVTQVRDYFERTWAMIPDEHYWAEDIEWVADTEQAAVATYTYHWKGTIGGEMRSGAGRATNVFMRTEHGWRLTHEHLSSLPLGDLRQETDA